LFEKKAAIKIRNSVLIPWVISYVLIMLIPIFFSGIVYFKTVGIIRRDIIETNSAALKQIQQTLDSHLREIEDLSLRINSNSKVRTLMDVFSGNYSITSSYATVKNVLDMNSELSTYALANGFIKNFSLNFNEGDFVWSAYSIFDKQTYFNQSNFSQDFSYPEWVKLMNKKYVNHYSGSNDGGISFLQSLPIGSPAVKANLLVMLDENKIRDLLMNAGWYSNNTIFILDKDDRTLLSASTGKGEALPVIHFADLVGGYGLLEAKTKTEKFVVSYISSQQAQWKYVYVVPFFVFSEKVESVKNLTLFGLLLCAIVEGMVAVYFLRRNYNPLKRVITYLKTITGMLNNKGKNEFSFIEDSISQVFEEKEIISRELLRQNAALRGNIILKLLKGRYGVHNPDSQSLNTYGIHFGTDYFLVALFYIDDSLDAESLGKEKNDEEKLKTLQNVIAAEMGELFGAKFFIFVTEADEIVAAVMNFKNPPSMDWKHEGDEAFKRLVSVLRQKYSLNCSLAVGGLHETAKGITQAYHEALDAMEYQLFDWSSAVIFYDDVKEAQKRTLNYSYTGETEQKLLNAIILGDFERSQTIINDVFNENFASGIAGVQLAKCLMMDLVSTFLKALNSRGILEGMRILEDKILINELYACRTLEEIKHKLIEFLSVVCRYTLEYKEKHGDGKVVKKITALVEINFSDVNLNIAGLADLMNMNPKYISYVYREATGDSIVTLINKTRITYAKDLLKKGMSISEAAQGSGYGDSNAFIRIFKKYEGITPGRFRELK